ncbi:MAG: TlpA family protein disulfide reductase [Acidobacteriota bacterium]|nr:TlpA family protein disulfide reductase [Acidobacteriota bacterium]
MKFTVFLIFTFTFLFFTACDPAKPVSISNERIDRTRMPQTNLPMPPNKPIEQLGWRILDGKTETLGEYKGKVVVLDFWATYCPPCIEEIPHLKELQAKYGEQGLQIIGLHVGGEEDEPNVPAFIERLKIDYPLAVPEDELTYALLGTDNRIPQTLVFDRNGKLVKQFVAYDDEIKKQLNETIEETVNK